VLLPRLSELSEETLIPYVQWDAVGSLGGNIGSCNAPIQWYIDCQGTVKWTALNDRRNSIVYPAE